MLLGEQLVFGAGDEGKGVGCFVQAAEFTEAAESEQPLRGTGEFDEAEGVPEIFAEAGRDSLFAKVGELGERGDILGTKLRIDEYGGASFGE